jgi:hypothetical protein
MKRWVYGKFSSLLKLETNVQSYAKNVGDAPTPWDGLTRMGCDVRIRLKV